MNIFDLFSNDKLRNITSFQFVYGVAHWVALRSRPRALDGTGLAIFYPSFDRSCTY